MKTHQNNNKILWTVTHLTPPEVIWKRLETLGYQIIVADKETVNKIESLSPRVWVGKIGGEPNMAFSLLEDVKSKWPNLPVILISIQPSVDEAVKAIKLGAFEYITKNVSSERLWAILERALENPSQISSFQSHGAKTLKLPSDPIAVHPSVLKVMELAKKIAPSRCTVLINGETGVGKEVIARFIHNHSDRKDGPFIAINCAALPENLLESELFGHEKGAFTGAITRKKGKFELAHGGTLLLDEVSEMVVSVQAKLLRVLQEREIDRVGGQLAIPVDVRVMATTNRNLVEETKNGHFRLDLFYRLNVVPLTLPPLRERPEDIGPLANFFLSQYCALNNCPMKTLSPDAIDFLKKRPWPGNVREFENAIERITLLVEKDVIHAIDLDSLFSPLEQRGREDLGLDYAITLKEMEKRMIFQALNNQKGNRTHAAKMLGISVRTLRNKLHEYQDVWENEGYSHNK